MHDDVEDYIEYISKWFLKDTGIKNVYRNRKIASWKREFLKPLLSWPLTTLLSGIRGCFFTMLSFTGIGLGLVFAGALMSGDDNQFKAVLTVYLKIIKKTFQAWQCFFLNAIIPLMLIYRFLITGIINIIRRNGSALAIPDPVEKIADLSLIRDKSLSTNVTFLTDRERKEIEDLIHSSGNNAKLRKKIGELDRLSNVYRRIICVRSLMYYEEPSEIDNTFVLAVPQTHPWQKHTFSPDLYYLLGNKMTLVNYSKWAKEYRGGIGDPVGYTKRAFYPVFIREGADNTYYPDSQLAHALIKNIRMTMKDIRILKDKQAVSSLQTHSLFYKGSDRTSQVNVVPQVDIRNKESSMSLSESYSVLGRAC